MIKKEYFYWSLPLFLWWLLMPFPSLYKDMGNQTVLITGASQGIGRSLVEQYAKKGVKHIVIAARNKAKLDAVKADTIARYPKVAVTVIPADLSSEQKCKNLIQQTLNVLGKEGLTTLILNHITSSNFGTWFGDAPRRKGGQGYMTEMFTVNTFSYIWLTTAAMPSLKANNGYVGVVSSLAGYVGIPQTAVYSATKHALHGFFNSLRLEMRLEKDTTNTGVSITLCAIGPTDTEGTITYRGTLKLPGVHFEPPQYAARAIVDGVNARQREIYHPHYMLFPCILLSQIVPEVLDFILLLVYG